MLSKSNSLNKTQWILTQRAVTMCSPKSCGRGKRSPMLVCTWTWGRRWNQHSLLSAPTLQGTEHFVCVVQKANWNFSTGLRKLGEFDLSEEELFVYLEKGVLPSKAVSSKLLPVRNASTNHPQQLFCASSQCRAKVVSQPIKRHMHSGRFWTCEKQERSLPIRLLFCG